MFGNYLKVALRNFLRHKGYSIINVAGLALGMACCILILLWIQDQLSYDRFHVNAENIYRIGVDADFSGGAVRRPISTAPSGPALRDACPEVIDAVRFYIPAASAHVSYEDQVFFENEVFYTDNSIFDIFTFPLVRGYKQAALSRPYTAVITEELARKYFGDEDPLGRVLQINNSMDFTVTGVAQNVTGNSHFTFDILCSMATQYALDAERMENWINHTYYTYLLLAEGCDYREVERKLNAVVETHLGPTLDAMGGSITNFLQPLTSIHLHSHMENELSGNGNIAYVYLFAATALFILLIACINFVNLSTARSALRGREVGLRKTLGADRGRLIRQFLGESLLCSFLALTLTFILLELALPLFNSLTGREIQLNYLATPWLIPVFAALATLVGLAAGSYPAFFLSAFQPVRVLKGHGLAGGKRSVLRRTLVVTQFAISITLIIGTIVIHNQLSFMKNKHLGFTKEHVLVIPEANEVVEQSLELVRQKFAGIPEVVSVGLTTAVPGGTPNVQMFVPEGIPEDQAQLMDQLEVDHNFIATLGMEIVAGRNFSAALGSDTLESVIVNETAARRFGWSDPVGKSILIPDDFAPEGFTWAKRTVIGVVKDFHIASLRKKIEPLIIENMPRNCDDITIRIKSDDLPRAMGRIEDTWKEIAPEKPFDYYFLDQSFDSQYRAEERLGRILFTFTLLGIAIGCLGLFGLSAFIAERRTKEIGLRKILGASVSGIMLILAGEFARLVLLANVIAWPLAYFAIRRWLENFAYQTPIDWVPFALGGILALFIALVAVSFQSIKAALANPTEALRHE